MGEAISFTMRITNTGSVLISSLPLSDSYDTRYLQYVSASVAPDDNNDDGQLNWSSVTGAGTLAPGAHLDVSVNFVAFHDTTLLPGGATVNTARSGVLTSTASVRINTPTAVEIANKVVQVVDGQVVVQWSTVTENTLVGFYLWREDGSGQVVRLTNDLILAQKAGQSSGAAYRYIDTTATPGAGYRYVLELIDTSGLSSYSELGRSGGQHSLYLPLLRKQ